LDHETLCLFFCRRYDLRSLFGRSSSGSGRRENLSRDPTAKPTKIEVSVVDNSSPLVGVKDVRCRALTASRFGLAVSAGAFASTVGTNSAGTILNLPIPAAVNSFGALTVQCTIPRRGTGDPNSFVGSIKLTEITAAGD
jgi:hypothetical protein